MATFQNCFTPPLSYNARKLYRQLDFEFCLIVHSVSYKPVICPAYRISRLYLPIKVIVVILSLAPEIQEHQCQEKGDDEEDKTSTLQLK